MNLKEANQNSHPAQRWLFEVWEQPLNKVGNASKVVAGVIAACAWGGKDTAHPSYRSIAEATGQSSKTISKAVRQLTEAGLVVVEKKKSKAGTYNSYRLTFPVGTEDLLSLQGEVAFPTETPCFPYEDGSLYTGKAEAIKETPKEATKETLTTTEEEEERVVPSLDYLPLPNQPLPLDAFARDEHIDKATPNELDDLWKNIETSTEHIDRALVRKDYANSKRRAWGLD